MTSLTDVIAAEIRSREPIPFARFMELVLYHSEFGYYESSERRIGRAGDFYTSASTGSLFGELLGFQFAQWQIEFGGGPFQIVEAGAHDGRLAGDILKYLREWRSEAFRHATYLIVEPSSRRQSWQETQLREFVGHVKWVRSLEELPPGGIRGVVFANELLDALPVTRLGWDAAARCWFEWGVAEIDGRFVWRRLASDNASNFETPILPEELLAVLPDGFTTEVCPPATRWWRAAAARLVRGHLLTLDYGLSAEEFFAPSRREGTLRAYRQHQIVSDVLADPGSHDLTAHVNFSALKSAGEAKGLTTMAFVTQTKFLTEIASQAWETDASFATWSAERTRQFQALTHPDHLGRAFRVLLQRK